LAPSCSSFAIAPAARAVARALDRSRPCFVSDDVVGVNSWWAFKRDVYRRHHARTIVIGTSRVLQMDAEQLAFEDASFDCMLCGFALFFFPNLEGAMSEVRRVLKPGGIAIGIAAGARV